jgi:tetratricopeptide (TPR) repeat protein
MSKFDNKAEEYMRIGDQYFQQQDYQSALFNYKYAISLKPDDLNALLAYTDTLVQMEEIEQAIQQFNKIIALYPTHADAYNNLGCIYYKQGKLEKAEENFKKAIELCTDNNNFMKNLGDLYLQQKKYSDAISIFNNINLKYPQDIESLLSLGECYLNLGEKEVAQIYYQRILLIDPQNYVAKEKLKTIQKTNLANCNENDSAVQSVSEEQIKQYLEFGIQLSKSGNYKEASDVFRKILEVMPNQPQALHNLALMEYQQGNPENAVQILKQAVESDPQFPEAHNTLGLIYFQLNDYYKALTEFRKAISKNIYYDNAYNNYKFAADRLNIPLSDDQTDIVFYTGGHPFNGRTVYEKGLGGSESALFYIARELANLGYNVRVFNNCDKPGNYEGVEYQESTDFYIYNHFNQMKIFICSRFLKPFKLGVKAKLKILWIHDTADVAYSIIDQDFKNINSVDVDKIYALGKWQASNWMQYFKIPAQKIYITRNGIDTTLFKENSQNRNPNKLLYTTRPPRGLQILLDIFPRIKSNHPEAELHFFTYQAPENDDEMKPLMEKVKQPGVFMRGSLTKLELAKELQTSHLLVYPSVFTECCSISTIEAQAAGLPIITTNLASLPETIENNETGVLIDGDPNSTEYQDEFLKQTLRLLKDEQEWKRFSEKGKQRGIEYFDWKVVAREWHEQFQILLKEKYKNDNSVSNIVTTQLSKITI